MNTLTRHCIPSLSRLSQSISKTILLHYAYANLPKFNLRGLYKRSDDVRANKHRERNERYVNVFII